MNPPTMEVTPTDEETPIFYPSGRSRRVTPEERPSLPFSDAELARRLAQLVARWREGGEVKKEINQRIHFGRYVREQREQRQLSLGRLAEEADLQPDQLFLLERGLLPIEDVQRAVSHLAAAFELRAEEVQTTFEAAAFQEPPGSSITW